MDATTTSGPGAEEAPNSAPVQSPTPTGPVDSAGVPIDLSGRTVAIDPGHNGGNARHMSEITKQVPDGRGGMKDCNTTGTATASDYSEAEFAWQVASLLVTDLEDAGAAVVVSREDNDGVGPCVDERGTFADSADLLVSIHADGAESTSVKGFHVIVADPPVHKRLEGPANDLAQALSAAMSQGFTPNRAYGKHAISHRPDLAGLNNANVPAVIVECGEMRNPAEAKRMESATGRAEYAHALFTGIADWYAEAE